MYQDIRCLESVIHSRFDVKQTMLMDVDAHPADLNSFAAWYRRGDELANQKRYQDALDSFDQALAIDPNSSEALVFRGVMLIYLGRYRDALTSCDRALEINPNEVEAWIFRGAALRYLGQYKKAYASYERALELGKESNHHVNGELNC